MAEFAVRWNRFRYRCFAPVYDRLTRPLERGRRRAIESLDLQPGERLLLVGCGTGADLEYVPAGVDVTAIDFTPEMVRRTAKRASELGRKVDARVMDARSLDFADEAFDAATLHLVLAVVPGPATVAGEVDRVLAPGGRASVFDKFLAEGEGPSLVRRFANPVARALFSDLNRRLEPLLVDTDLSIESREGVVRGLYTVAGLEKRSHEDGSEAR